MSPRSLLLFGFIATLATASGEQVYEESPTVQITQGTLRGSTSTTADGTKYYRFLGIPYAKPPVGDLRFKAPEDPEPWSGVRDATNFGSKCYQSTCRLFSQWGGGGTEDCLFVNVFTPELPTNGSQNALRPVMVYIHGGAFVVDSGNLAPGHLMDYGVVVVSMNYRLSVFGFLSINGTDTPGNAGLKDQAAALRWVQKNIAQFGGDPSSVTIFGASAGGVSAHYQVLSPMSKGLFHRAISESATALNTLAFVKNLEPRAYRLGELLGNKTTSATELLQVLRTAPASDIMDAVNNVLNAEEEEGQLVPVAFLPTLEFPREGETPFLSHEPSYIAENGLYNQVPYIAGVTRLESSQFVYGTIVLDPSYWQKINDNLEQIVPKDLGLARGSQRSLEVANKVKSFYFGNKTISNETIDQWIDLQSDTTFIFGVQKTIHAQAKYSANTTYNYYFVYGDAYHTMEFNYLTYGGQVQGQDTDGAKLARLVGGMWTSFVKTGVPSVEGEVAWQPVRQGSYPYLEINTTLSLKNDLEKHRMDFWFDIYKNYSNSTSGFRNELLSTKVLCCLLFVLNMAINMYL